MNVTASVGVCIKLIIESASKRMKGVKMIAVMTNKILNVPIAFAACSSFLSPIRLAIKTVPPIEIPNMIPVIVCMN